MKERQILFASPMVRAILEFRKTQTRRIVKIPGIMPRTSFAITSPDEEIIRFDDGTFHYLSTAALSGPYPCPYGQPGDRLWVREAWRTYASIDDIPPRSIWPGAGVQYEAGGSNVAGANRLHGMGKFRPGRFMPRWASRITLEITSVRVERLQDISPDDCIAEGCWPAERRDLGRGHEAVADYCALWEQINGTGSWGANPWVWVIKFKAVTP